MPGIGRIGFGWNGKVFALNTDNPAQTHLYFNGNEIATDTRYGRLHSAVTPVAVNLQTPLENPPSMVPQYSTFLFLGDMGTLTLKGMSNVSYAVVAVPEPSSLALFLAGHSGPLSVPAGLVWRLVTSHPIQEATEFHQCLGLAIRIKSQQCVDEVSNFGLRVGDVGLRHNPH